MPLWDFHTSKNILSADEKKHLAHEINKIYLAAGLPAFYVNVRFTEYEADNIFNGGVHRDDLIIIRIEHLARNFKDLEGKRNFRKRADAVLNPVFKPKGVFWEYAITDFDRDLWEINGIEPPLPGSDLEKKWVETNEPTES